MAGKGWLSVARWLPCLVCFLRSLACVVSSSCLPSLSSLALTYEVASSSDHSLAPALQALSDAIWPFPRTGPIDTNPGQRHSFPPPPPSQGSPRPSCVFPQGSLLPLREEGADRIWAQTVFGVLARESGRLRWTTSYHFTLGHKPCQGLGHGQTLSLTHTTLVWFRFMTRWQPTYLKGREEGPLPRFTPGQQFLCCHTQGFYFYGSLYFNRVPRDAPLTRGDGG